MLNGNVRFKNGHLNSGRFPLPVISEKNQPASAGVKNFMNISGGGFSVWRGAGRETYFGGGFLNRFFERLSTERYSF